MTTEAKIGRRHKLLLTVGAGAVALVVTACGGGSSSSTGPTASSGTLRRVEVHVDQGTTAQVPRTSMVARLAGLVGWPQVAEAHPGIQGCTVSDGSQTVMTDANGLANLTDVGVPTTLQVDCAGFESTTIPVDGPDGAVVRIRVRGRAGEPLRVDQRDVDVSPSDVSVSGVSQSSPSPSQSSDTSGSNSGSS